MCDTGMKYLRPYGAVIQSYPGFAGMTRK